MAKSPRYSLKLKDYEEKGSIERMEKDGFTREQIFNGIYRVAEGCSREERTKLIDNVFEREKR